MPKYKKTKNPKQSDQSSPDNMTSSTELLRILEERRLKERLVHKKLKAEVKLKETAEEKRSRRLREKQAKLERRRQRMGWDVEYQRYTNEDNPFGDSNLMSSFLWSKKLEKEGLQDVSVETVEVLTQQKQMENRVELEKVRRRRIEREAERQAREDDLTMQQRTREAAQFEEWERQEENFHLEQARLRSTIRIQDGRAKPIDLLAQYVSCSKLEDSIEMQMHEPYMLLDGLSEKDLEDLLIDIKVYVELEKGSNNEFWNDMTVIVEDEILKKKKSNINAMNGRRQGIHENVIQEVSTIFRGKNIAQLEKMRRRIEEKIAERCEGVDINYWESLLSQLKAHMARARLRSSHQQRLHEKLTLLKTISMPENITKQESNISSAILSSRTPSPKPSNSFTENCYEDYEGGSYSPQYLTEVSIDKSLVITEKQDEKYLNLLRIQLVDKLQNQNIFSQEELDMRFEAKKDMLPDEAEFSVETPVETVTQLVSDKYRPRKPRYFNRVHTGFEWNKYNQTHYDMDNPPPKIVQGYKFNIFYPDLIDKSETPQYFLAQSGENSDFAILRFHAGPPYEDIAFKIVNREWEFSYKRGFRCQFHNNIFQLWFHFKRYRYRR